MNLNSFFAIGAGAAIGAWLRWGLSLALNPVLPSVPLGTLAANLIGGLLMGIAMGATTQVESLSPEMRLLIITGFLGGLTTFSAFSGETVTLLLRQQYSWTFAIIGLHLIGSLAMTLIGIGMMRWLLRT